MLWYHDGNHNPHCGTIMGTAKRTAVPSWEPQSALSYHTAILGSDSPQSNNRKDNSLWVTPFIPRERPNVKHTIAGYLRLPQPTSAPALMRVLHWLRC